jgi:hypothetical protein
MTEIPWRAAVSRNVVKRWRKPSGSWRHATYWRKQRMVLNPSPAAQPSSRSAVAGSKLSACHHSVVLAAELGT